MRESTQAYLDSLTGISLDRIPSSQGYNNKAMVEALSKGSLVSETARIVSSGGNPPEERANDYLEKHNRNCNVTHTLYSPSR